MSVRARRKSVFLSIVLLIGLLFSAPSGTAGAAGPSRGVRAAAAAATPGFDPKLPVHPYLQYGAQADPNRRVRIIIQKTNPAVSSREIARHVHRDKARQSKHRTDELRGKDRDADEEPDERVHREFAFVKSLVMEVPLRKVLQLARQPGVRYISYDGPVTGQTIDTSRLKTTYQAAINVPQIWNGSLPATGKGVTVAVLDTGVNRNHPDIPSNTVAVQVDASAAVPNTDDFHGHGTHVIGTIVGKDLEGRYIGVAPDARVISVKISDSQGMSTEADLIRGLEWVYDNRTTYNIRVVNLSVSAAIAQSYVTSPITAAVEQLWLNGVTVVTAAGNRGGDVDATWYAPGNDPFVITVGAIDNAQSTNPADERLASFSSHGLTQDGYYKPDIVAPGRKVVAPLAGPTVTLATKHPNWVVDNNYIRLSGTSMSAPMVTGVVALLLERYPNLTPDQVKWLLTKTASSYPEEADAAGLVDSLKALQQAATGWLDVANQGVSPNDAIDPESDAAVTDEAFWSQAFWSQAFWNQAFWSQTSERVDMNVVSND